MARSGWKQWDEEQAEHELQALRRSGEPLEIFARSRGYSGERLRRWGARLKKAAAPVLLPVRVIAAPAEPAGDAPPVEVVLCSGRVLRVARGFDAGQLAELVRVLEALPC